MYRVKPFAWIKSSAGQKDEKNDKNSEFRAEKVRVLIFRKDSSKKTYKKIGYQVEKKGACMNFPKSFFEKIRVFFFFGKSVITKKRKAQYENARTG